MEFIIIAVLIGLIPAFIAKKKGYSFGLWWLYGAAIFIVALPHALIMKAAVGSEEDTRLKAQQAMASGQIPTRNASVDFVADGVLRGTPYRTEPDGSIVALIGERYIRFRNSADLEKMLSGV